MIYAKTMVPTGQYVSCGEFIKKNYVINCDLSIVIV